MEPVDVLRTSFPTLRFEEVSVVDEGWDSLVLELDGTWIFRFPRRPEVAARMEREITLVSELAAALPVAVPRFEYVARNGLLCVGYRKLAGSPARFGLTERTGRDLGRFLLALHATPHGQAAAAGVPNLGPWAWREGLEKLCADFRCRVLPLLPERDRADGERLLAAIPEPAFRPALIHADLGPDHVLCHEGRVVGVIDWSDARVGDPALDLAWCLNGTPREVADAVLGAYPVDERLRERSLFYHRLGPWYEVVHGLETGQEAFVASGVAGIRARLSA
ncbi:MAG TPA: phosphotransferase [Gaiellaceae bacterium]|nr:phosphotransferase [Gaiellaceae bacterium]